MGVPIGVEENTSVSGAEVDPQPPRPRRQQEHEELGLGVELLDLLLPVQHVGRPVDAVELPAPVGGVVPVRRRRKRTQRPQETKNRNGANQAFAF